MSGHQNPPDLKDFDARLKAAQKVGAEKEEKAAGRREASRSAGIGMRIGIELLAAVLVGGAIGLFIDNWLETAPIFTLAFTALGFAAGVMDVLRVLKGLDSGVGLGRAIREKEAKGKNGED
jgi:ATP synthase protein I